MSDMDVEFSGPFVGEFDFSGLKCPLPVLKARRALKELSSGEVISVLADDPAAPLDFMHFCETAGHELISSKSSDKGTLFIIRKG